MASSRLPTLFLSHGAPTLAFEDIPARDFLRGLSATLPRPHAILMASAHWNTDNPAVGGAERPATVHDFYGFPPPLYELRYAAPGAPAVAERVVALLSAAGVAATVDKTHGLDHGAWSPLLMVYPQADIPVLQLSIQARCDPRHHYAIGRALSALRDEGVLVVGSGGAVHNLHEFAIGQFRSPDWAVAFDDWLAATIAARHWEHLLDYRRLAPHAARAHPTDEHFLPLFVALGAAGENPDGEAIHRSFAHGSISMASFAFD